jgi:hypothetical protein
MIWEQKKAADLFLPHYGMNEFLSSTNISNDITQGTYKDQELLLLTICKRWSKVVNEDSQEISELISRIFPMKTLEQIVSWESSLFTSQRILDFVFQLPFITADFYHRLLLDFIKRIAQNKSDDVFTTSIIHIITHKHNVIDINITTTKPHGYSMLFYAIWRSKTELIECLLHHHVEEKKENNESL